MNFEEWWIQFAKEIPSQLVTIKEIALAAWMGAVAVGKEEIKPEQCCARLIDNGNQKINCIKIIREHTDLGLKESKDLVESMPMTLKGYNRTALSGIVKDFQSIGAKAEFYSGNCDKCVARFKCFTERN